MPYCAQCGTDMGKDPSTCANCGWRWPEEGSPESASLGQNVEQPVNATGLRYQISTNCVFLMTFLSYGLYLFYWFYLTWKQYRDSTGQEAYAIWHALTLLVPIYEPIPKWLIPIESTDAVGA